MIILLFMLSIPPQLLQPNVFYHRLTTLHVLRNQDRIVFYVNNYID